MVPPAAWKQIQRIGRVGNALSAGAPLAAPSAARAPAPRCRNERRECRIVLPFRPSVDVIGTRVNLGAAPLVREDAMRSAATMKIWRDYDQAALDGQYDTRFQLGD